MRAPTSLRDRAAQLVFPRLGSNMPPPEFADSATSRMESLLDEVPLGGVVLFRGRSDRTPAALAQLQRRSRYPLLVGADLERGAGQQISGGAVLPHAMAFGAAGDRAPALVHHAGWLAAREALSYGIQWLFAPVADVHSNPRNPIISTRSFGTDPAAVAELVTAFVAGCREGGVLTTAKHFPGHGDTETDSHETLPVLLRTRDEMERLELVPFRAAVVAGVDAVMTAHVSYPALDPSGLPATRSARILRDLLRGDLGFRGVVVSDSLLMAGAEPDDLRAPELVEAGIDVLLDVPDPRIAVDELVDAVERGRLDERLLDEAFQRVWSLKKRLAARHGPDVFVAPPPAPNAGTEARAVAVEVADLAMRGLGELPADWPRLARERGVSILVFRPIPRYPDPTMAAAEDLFSLGLPGSHVETVGADVQPAETDRLVEVASRAGVCVAALVVKPAAWHPFGLHPTQERLLERLLAGRTVLLSLGSPDVLPAFGAKLSLCTFSDVEASVGAAVRRLSSILLTD